MLGPPPSLLAKTRPPPLPQHLVRGEALARCFAGAEAARVLLVRAPAGFGKTTAMLHARAQLEGRGLRTAWLTLDAADNDVPRFLAGLHAAASSLAGREATQDPRIALAAASGSPFALFLDDFEQVQETAVLRLVTEIADALPAHGRLVIGSRVSPGLGLARWRARGLLAEVGPDELRFTCDDTAKFLRLRGIAELPPEVLAHLQRRTEGWAAALWLASLALQRQASGADWIARIAGSEEDIAAYLAEDVLAAQPPALREFLLHTSVLHELTLPLCQALLPHADAAGLIAQIEASGLFATAMPGPSPRWRYHSLFADVLRSRLRRVAPAQAERLHAKASRWYLEQDRPVPAIDHALWGGHHREAVRLLALHGEGLAAQGRMRLLARWFAQVPPALLPGEPLAHALAVWSTCFTQGAEQALVQLEALEATAPRRGPARAHAAALRPMLLSMMDRVEEAYAAGQAGLARLPTGRPFADGVLANCMASIAAVLERVDEARGMLARVRADAGPQAFVHAYTDAVEALLDLQDGRLREAGARFRLALARDARGQASGTNAWAGVLYAQLVYDADALEECEQMLGVFLPMVRDLGLPDHMIVAYSLRARAAFARGDVGTAFALLAELEVLGQQRRLPRVAASARLERARLLLLQGHRDAARDEIERADDAAVWAQVARLRWPAHEVEDLALARLRWGLQAAGAVRQVEAALAQEPPARRPQRRLKLRWLRALALEAEGRRGMALEALAAVLEAAQAEGQVRLLADEGPAAAGLLRAWLLANEGASPLLRAHAQRVLDATGPAPEPLPEDEAPAEAPLAEPLSRKEVRVLQLVAEGYSNSALAAHLFVSDSTVRTHLRRINQKTGARSRSQAVAVARRLGLLR